MEYLKELIVDIYYNCGIYCVHLRTFFLKKFHLFLAHRKRKGKKIVGVFKGIYSRYLL